MRINNNEDDMTADYLDAHQRHWDDAERLRGTERWANADHLYGIATECGLKRLMLAFGMTFDVSKGMPAEGKDREHANGIWARYESYRSGHPQGAAYALPAVNPFADWHVSQRYAPQAAFDRTRVEKHRRGAESVSLLVKQAHLEGVV